MKPKVVYSDRADAAARNAARIQETAETVATVLADLPEADNEPGAVDHMIARWVTSSIAKSS